MARPACPPPTTTTSWCSVWALIASCLPSGGSILAAARRPAQGGRHPGAIPLACGKMARVLVTRTLPGDAVDRLAAQHEVDVWPEPLPPPHDELTARVRGADALLSMLTDRVDAELLAAAPNLRAVANYAV